MNEGTINKEDLRIMKLLHYFITEQGYNPIVIHGVENEIWLESQEGPYRIVRIMTGYIHNEEQLNYDVFKTNRIVKKIKLKTLSFKVNVLSIYANLSEYVKLQNYPNMNSIDLKKNGLRKKEIIDYFPDINIKTKFKETGFNLFTKITKDINKKNSVENKKIESIFNNEKPYITYALIAINVIIFFAMYLLGNGSQDLETLFNFGALEKDSVLINHEYFRIISSMFLHIGLMHLILNMYALNIIGKQIERFFGKYKYILIYFTSGIFGSLISLAFMPSNTIAAGASGAIFGLLGSLLYFGFHFRAFLGNRIINQIIPILALNLLMGLVIPNIGTAAHIGGLLGGILISYTVGIKHKENKTNLINGIILTFLSFVFIYYLLFIK